jgi:thioredoxin reductase
MSGKRFDGRDDVAIIGAGPYGLSVGAHLRARGVDFRIFGEPMATWQNNMPQGMLLKSYAWASNLSAPPDLVAKRGIPSGSTLRQFCTNHGFMYNDRLIPISLQTFTAYGQAFQSQFVPYVERRAVLSVRPERDGFRLRFEDGGTAEFRRVIVAVGLTPFKYLPPIANRVPQELVSHSSDFGPLARLDGKQVIIVGSGSSATDLAALLHERGGSVSLVARSPTLRFAIPPRFRGLTERLLAPGGGLGNGWGLSICANAPWMVHALPREVGNRLGGSRALGPLGGAFMRDRVMDKVPMRLGRTLTGMKQLGGKLQLSLRTTDGAEERTGADHVVFATGYRIDPERLSFLSPSMIDALRSNGGAITLSSHYESALPGLHFIGPAASEDFGPVNRFIFGARHPALHLARYLPAALGRRISLPLSVAAPIQADPAVPL